MFDFGYAIYDYSKTAKMCVIYWQKSIWPNSINGYS